jgi:alpha-L-rhamnosidase
MPKEAYSTAFFAHGADVVARMARILGLRSEAKTYGTLARKVRAAFVREFVEGDGRILGDTQAGYAMALQFDLLPARLRTLAVSHLLRTLKRESGKLTTGFQSTIRLMNELSRRGRSDLAYSLALRTEMPSWGYMVENGGTTIWERWDGWVKGRGFQNPGMNSFNHYAIGAVGEWVWRPVAGINPDESEPGYRHFIIRPIPGGGLSSARGEYRAITGTIVSHWRIEDGLFTLDVTVPCNTSATVYLPGCRAGRTVGSGRHTLRLRLKGKKMQGQRQEAT